MHHRSGRAPAATLRIPAFLAAVLLAVLLQPLPADAQSEYRISQRGTVSQKLGATTISLDYSRPLARGRSDLFGDVVIWGELWTPGANEATVLELSDTVKLNGHPVLPGRWSMWVIPSRVGPWELVLEPNDSLFHTQRPDLTDEQVRFVIEAQHDAPHTEALTWSFPRIAQDGATLVMNWGTTEIPLEVEVRSLEPATTIAADEASQYVGDWNMVFTPDPETGQGPPPTVLTVRYGESGQLLAKFPPGVFSPPEDTTKVDAVALAKLSPQERERQEAKRHLREMNAGEFEYVLIPRARGVFLMGWQQDGVLMDVEELFHEFEFENGRAVRMTVRDHKDEVMGKATRDND